MRITAAERATYERQIVAKNPSSEQLKAWCEFLDALVAGRLDGWQSEKSVAEMVEAWSAEVNFDPAAWQAAARELEDIIKRMLETKEWDSRTGIRERKIFELLKTCAEAGTAAIPRYPQSTVITVAVKIATGERKSKMRPSPQALSVANQMRCGGLPYNSPQIRALGVYSLEPAGCKVDPVDEFKPKPGIKFVPGCRFEAGSKIKPGFKFNPFCELDPACKPPLLRAPKGIAELIIE